MTNQDALLLYEIYSEHIITTRKLQQVYSWQNKLSEFSVLTPEFFVLDKEYNTKIELYIRSLRDNSFAQVPADNCSFSMITDASRILNDFMVQNHKNSFYRKTVFEAPRTANKNKFKDHKRIHPSGIKVIHTMPNLISRKTEFTQRTLEVQNTAIDVSANFEGGLTGGDGNRPHMALSTCPLTGGESFLRDDNHGNILENMSTNIQNAY